MWWESSGDCKMDGSGSGQSLIALVANGLGGFGGRHLDTTENELRYPRSKYQNLKAGMPGE
jgi:chitinase